MFVIAFLPENNCLSNLYSDLIFNNYFNLILIIKCNIIYAKNSIRIWKKLPHCHVLSHIDCNGKVGHNPITDHYNVGLKCILLVQWLTNAYDGT